MKDRLFALAVAAFVLLAFWVLLGRTVVGHGSTEWIMENTVTRWCCGPQECAVAEPGELVRLYDAWLHVPTGLFYGHEAINHSAGEYVRGGVSTNSIESVWAVLKRGLHGVYHHASKKHIARYVDEFTFRLNDGNVKRHTLERLASLVTASFRPRVTFKELTA